ncbi:MAG: hypothetical protein DRG59_10920 [Deltaproteobacteria bacterium]|nr:MAG: hypothetical protein DRG59_10920 [Deltaproteobacteria bacterium]
MRKGIMLIAVYVLSFVGPSTYEGEVSWVMKHSKLSKGTAQRIVHEAHKGEYPTLILAICKVESHFNPNAVSSAGAIGLGQIMPLWIPKLKEAKIVTSRGDLFDIATNIKATRFILRYLSEREKSLIRVLYRYYGKRDRQYVRKVLLAVGEIVYAREGRESYRNHLAAHCFANACKLLARTD